MEREELFSLPWHPHHILYLGHCQPTKQNFHELTKRVLGGGSLGRKRRTQAENREPLAIGPTQRDFPKHCSCRNYTPGEVNAQEWALKHRGGTWHSTLLRHQSVFNFPNFCVLFQIEPTAFGACPEPLQNSFMGKHLSICGVTEPHAHTHASPCLGCLGVCTKALKRF